jgi:glycosyltransferase involved in cell wall biosynthesis
MIALVSTTHGPGHGAEVVLGELLSAWRADAPPLLVLAPVRSGAADAAADSGTAWLPLPSSHDGFVSSLRAAMAAAPELRSARLVHAWSARGLEVSWWLGRHLGIPATATVHDHPDASAQTALRRRLWRRTVNLQSAVAFPSAALERAWRAAGFARTSRVVHNGASRLQLRSRRRTEGELVIGFLGMYAPWKGFEIARSWALADWPESVRWTFFGGIHASLERRAAALAAVRAPRLAFRGPQPREQIFAEMDILVHCSTEFDPFPTVLLEAAQAGVPVVASSLGGAGEIVEHGKTGFLFDPTQPNAGLAFVRQLVGDTGLRTQLGSAARERYGREFRAERMAEEYAAFWQAALEAPSGASRPDPAGTPDRSDPPL